MTVLAMVRKDPATLIPVEQRSVEEAREFARHSGFVESIIDNGVEVPLQTPAEDPPEGVEPVDPVVADIPEVDPEA